MKKTILYILLAIVLVVLPFGAACKSSSTSTATGVIELTINDHDPPQSTIVSAWKDWVSWIEQESGGKLKINYVPGGALYTGDEAFRAVKEGAVDGAHYVVDKEDGFLLNLVMSLPFMGWKEQHVESKFKALLDKFPEMQKEWEGVTIISLMMMPPTQLHTTSKAVKTPADLKGLRIMGAETMTISAIQVAGGTTVELPITDMTPSLQTNLIDGVINHFPVCGIFGAFEFLKYHTVFGSGGINMTPMFFIMNTKKFNSLPKDIQDLLKRSGDVWLQKHTEWDNVSYNQAMEKTQGHTFINLTPDEIKVWYNLVKEPIHEKWIKECEDKGLPGRKVYEEALKLASQ